MVAVFMMAVSAQERKPVALVNILGFLGVIVSHSHSPPALIARGACMHDRLLNRVQLFCHAL